MAGYSKFSVSSKADINQLSKSVGYSRVTLGSFRDKRHTLLREYVGKNYSNNGSTEKVPVNLLELAMNIYLQRLVAKSPAVSISTQIKQLKEICTRFELAGNHLVQEIDLGSTLEMAVTGAMFSIGIIKVGLNRTQVEVGGILHDAGQAFADHVSLDDWVHDMTADKFENGQYEGNFYHISIDQAAELYPDKIDKIIPKDEQANTDSQRDHSISEGAGTQREEFRPMVRCLDLWLPKQNLVLQCQASDDDTDPIGEVLNVIEWEGPERGPYHKLGFSRIENNTMPVAPAMHWKDLHVLSNKLFNKLGRQALREKTVHGVRVGGEKDGNRLIEAEDGEMISIDDPNNVADIHSGGISQESYAFFLGSKDLYSYFAGNLDMLGGLGPQSDTLGQDQLLSASASMRIQKMQKETIRFTTGVIKDLMFYLWNDPHTVLPLTKRLKGYEDVAIPVKFGPEDRESDFLEYNISIDPHSMQHTTPEAKLQGLRTILSEMIAPFVPTMEAQGITLDFEMLLKKVGKLGNIPELNDILVFTNPQHQDKPVGQPPAKAATTTRRYERINRPGATNSGKSQIMQQALFGKKPQATESDSLMRPTG